jgi:hypothetical protein
MAVGMKPGFVSGANARVKLDGKTLAYCTDLNYTVDMATVPIEAIGSYEVKAYEPIAYSVNGSFSVIRYTKVIKPASGSANGNPADELGGDNRVGTQLDPGRVLSSSTFDMEIFQSTSATASDTTETNQNSLFKIHDCRVTRRTSALSKRGVMVDSYAFVGILAGDTDSGVAVDVSTSGSKLTDLS